MKKLLLTSLVAVFAASGAQAADYFVGGSAAFGLDASHENGVLVAPEIGWHYSDKLDFGFNLAYGHEHESEYFDGAFGNTGPIDFSTNTYGIGAFARYNVAEFGGVKLLLKGGVAYEHTAYASSDLNIDDETVSSLYGYVIPMITYDISESFTLYANLNFLGVYAGYASENEYFQDDHVWAVGGGVDSSNVANTSDFQIGFLYNF